MLFKERKNQQYLIQLMEIPNKKLLFTDNPHSATIIPNLFLFYQAISSIQKKKNSTALLYKIFHKNFNPFQSLTPL